MGRRGSFTANIVCTLCNELRQGIGVEMSRAIALQVRKSAVLRFLSCKRVPPAGQPSEEVSESQLRDIFAGEQLLEKVFRPLFVFYANSRMPAVDEVKLNRDEVASARGKGALVEELGVRLSRVQGPSRFRGVVHVKDCLDIVGEDDVDVETASHTDWCVSKTILFNDDPTQT